MTTAHKPTYNAAVGHEDRGGSLRGPASKAVSAKDQPGHKTVKYRMEGQSAPTEVRAKDLKAELEERERKHRERDDDEETDEPRKRLEATKKEKPDFNPLDKDDSDSSDASSSAENSDEEAELMRELEKLTKEKEEDQRRTRAEKDQEDLESRAQSVLTGNPLLHKDDANVKKKWYDDVVFKHQARGVPEKKKARFINDTIRNDFHKKFLGKYVK